MGQPDGDGDGVSREEWIRGRIAEIRRNFDADAAELGALVAELEALGLSPEERRRRFRVIPGGLVLIGGAVAAAVARWVRGRPRLAAAMTGAGAAAVVAGALLAHGTPPPRPGATGPIPRPTASASVAPSASASPSAPSTKPGTPVPPLVPVPVPTARGRRPSAPAGAPSTPAGPQPTPTRPGPTKTPAVPSPWATSFPPPACPPGLVLEVIGLGVYVCV